MADFEGGGAGNLDYSSYSYEQLRAAVYGLSEEAIRVGINEWSDLKRRLNERVGTLRVAIAKLEPEWVSRGGRDAIGRLSNHLDWMDEFARVAAWNAERLTRVHETYHRSLKAMRELDVAPDRPNPKPGPSVGSGDSTNPADLNWKQPQAVQIANALYSEFAIAAATMARPPERLQKDTSPIDDGDGIPGDGPVAPRGHSSRVGVEDANGSSGGVARHESKAGGGSTSLVLSGHRSVSSDPISRNMRVPVAGSRSAGRSTSDAKSHADAAPGITRRSYGSGRAGLSGFGARRGGVAGSRGVPSGRAGPGGFPPGTIGPPADGGAERSGLVTDPEARALGGGMRPLPGTPAEPTGGRPPVGGVPPGVGGSAQGGHVGKKRPGYERAEPEIFLDGRRGNRAGGQVRVPGAEKVFDPMPGTLGAQKRKVVEERPGGWELTPEPAPSPQGFPDELRDFKQKDGTEFQVRRRSRGTQ